jgi:hypothetical protein
VVAVVLGRDGERELALRTAAEEHLGLGARKRAIGGLVEQEDVQRTAGPDRHGHAGGLGEVFEAKGPPFA